MAESAAPAAVAEVVATGAVADREIAAAAILAPTSAVAGLGTQARRPVRRARAAMELPAGAEEPAEMAAPVPGARSMFPAAR